MSVYDEDGTMMEIAWGRYELSICHECEKPVRRIDEKEES